MNNREIVACWERNHLVKREKYQALTTDGEKLWSYALEIGFTDAKGNKIVIDYTGKNIVSHTTGKHVGYAKQTNCFVLSPEALALIDYL